MLGKRPSSEYSPIIVASEPPEPPGTSMHPILREHIIIASMTSHGTGSGLIKMRG
jgi:hypothetical protein